MIARLAQSAAKIAILLLELSISSLRHDYHVLVGLVGMAQLADSPLKTVDVILRPLANRALRLAVIRALPLQLRRGQSAHAARARSRRSLLARAARGLAGVGIRGCVAILCSVRICGDGRAWVGIHGRPLVRRMEGLPRGCRCGDDTSHGIVSGGNGGLLLSTAGPVMRGPRCIPGSRGWRGRRAVGEGNPGSRRAGGQVK